MLYVLAVLLPPVAMLLCGRVIQAILCLLLQLTLIGWPVAAIWALLVVQNHNDEVRTDRLVDALDRNRS